MPEKPRGPGHNKMPRKPVEKPPQILPLLDDRQVPGLRDRTLDRSTESPREQTCLLSSVHVYYYCQKVSDLHILYSAKKSLGSLAENSRSLNRILPGTSLSCGPLACARKVDGPTPLGAAPVSSRGLMDLTTDIKRVA